MEDRVHLEADRDLYGNLNHLYAAVYDGHGGVQASEYVRLHLHNNIKVKQVLIFFNIFFYRVIKRFILKMMMKYCLLFVKGLLRLTTICKKCLSTGQ